MKHPPAARLTLRVGVTGHRPNGLVDANEQLLQARVREILMHAADAVRRVYDNGAQSYSSEPPVLRIVSALAEGADRIVAEEAVNLGWELQAPLPFPREEYERDFKTERSREAFKSLLESERTTAVFELDGSREDPSAYEAVGEIVIHQCDLLVAIWDGELSSRRGGTANIINEAGAIGLLTICIDARRPHAIHYLPEATDRGGSPFEFGQLETYIAQRLSPPADHMDGNRYLSEGQPQWTLGAIFPNFCRMVAGEAPAASFAVRDFVEETDAEWQSIARADASLGSTLRQLRSRFLSHYAWADRLADYYGNVYRTSFLLNYIFAAIAVLSALAPLALSAPRTTERGLVPFSGIELALLLSIIGITTSAHRFHLQDRWIEYRFLAERLRGLILLTPLGESMPAFKIAAYAKNSDPSNSWVIWHFAAIAREAGLISNRLDATVIRRYRTFMARYLAEQVEYHRRIASRFAKVERRLHRAGVTLFAMTLCAVVAHLFYRDATALTLLSAGLPACGAAIIGIVGQAEFHRVATRSEALAESLSQLLETLRLGESDAGQASRDLRTIAQSVAEVTQSELLDWRIVFRERPMTLPS